MRIPKYLEKALKDRIKAANQWNNADRIISDFILKNGLEDDIDTSDFLDGVEGLVNPEDSAERIRQAIRDKKRSAKNVKV